jgi:hypothetical protein
MLVYLMNITPYLSIESGVLYPICLILFLSLQLGLSSLDFFPILVQVVVSCDIWVLFLSKLNHSTWTSVHVVISNSDSGNRTNVDYSTFQSGTQHGYCQQSRRIGQIIDGGYGSCGCRVGSLLNPSGWK